MKTQTYCLAATPLDRQTASTWAWVGTSVSGRMVSVVGQAGGSAEVGVGEHWLRHQPRFTCIGGKRGGWHTGGRQRGGHHSRRVVLEQTLPADAVPVSYTHLTLPTICSV
eukprot:5923225-Alexandrium_andersonii.AAC.1